LEEAGFSLFSGSKYEELIEELKQVFHGVYCQLCNIKTNSPLFMTLLAASFSLP